MPKTTHAASSNLMAQTHSNKKPSVTFNDVSLDDKFDPSVQTVFASGLQAIVRMMILQQQLDERMGIHSAGFASGYRGSPLGGLDKAFWSAKKACDQHNIHFHPGLNEDLGATAVWGTQQTHLYDKPLYDGVFGLWYGKGPGVDRTGDVFKHANMAGTAQYGGVLALIGDDHTCKSSTAPHQSEYAMIDAGMPVVNPANINEYIDFGLKAWAISRATGLWASMKCIGETVDCSATIHSDLSQYQWEKADFTGEFALRWPDDAIEQEKRLHYHKWPLAQKWAKDLGLDKVLCHPSQPLHSQKKSAQKLGIVTTGKSYGDVCQALSMLGIYDHQMLEEMGIGLIKIGMSWPLEPSVIRDFSTGFRDILVIEEKRPIIEDQLIKIMYHLDPNKRPNIMGKTNLLGRILLPSTYELGPSMIAHILAKHILYTDIKDGIHDHAIARMNATIHQNAQKLGTLVDKDSDKDKGHEPPALAVDDDKNKGGIAVAEMDTPLYGKTAIEHARIPYYCSGCPHNRSTRVPDGSKALGGIGCHYMATWIDPNTQFFTHMGGEGVPWIGSMNFVETPHIFTNLGDGTYFHSGSLAVRAAKAANAKMTYKILYNDAVAMTGGQPVDGILTVPQITQQLASENIKKIVVVSDDIEKYKHKDYLKTCGHFADDTVFYHRDDFMQAQKDLTEYNGTSALIYDQTCAAEKRRRRKRGMMDDPNHFIEINPNVCEGCGDCSKKSNCLSVVPLETEMGTKRKIDQSSCNKDYSCVDGFCPSFVSVLGKRKKVVDTQNIQHHQAILDHLHDLPLVSTPPIHHQSTYNILMTGVGGTGIVTIGAIMAMAAHLEGKAAATIDMTGLAQKGGAVTCHIKIANKADDIHSVRMGPGDTDLLIGGDLLVASYADTLKLYDKQKTHAIVNNTLMTTGRHVQERDYKLPKTGLEQLLKDALLPDQLSLLPSGQIADEVIGDSIASNMLLLGAAMQRGVVPISVDAMKQAIRLNGVSVDKNIQSFELGRLMAINPDKIVDLLQKKTTANDNGKNHDNKTLDDLTLVEIMDHRMKHLTDYQNKKLARQYKDLMDRVINLGTLPHVEKMASSSKNGITIEDVARATAHIYAKILAYKDEYEVARMQDDPAFYRYLRDHYEDGFKLNYYLAAPMIARRDPETGHLIKRRFGGWIKYGFKLMKNMKFLRGTPLDIFGYTAERKMERQLIQQFEHNLVDAIESIEKNDGFDESTLHDLWMEIQSYADIRGFAHIKEPGLKAKLKGE